MAESLNLVGGEAPCAWSGVKARSRGFRCWWAGAESGVGRCGGDEGRALCGNFVTREGEGVGNLPALKLGHECGRVREAASWMVAE